MHQQVLVPYDASQEAKRALKYALEVYPERDVVLLHVVEPSSDGVGPGGFSVTHYERVLENAQSMLETAIEDFEDRNRIQTEVVFGRPTHEILRQIEQRNVSHVVMGNRGRDGAARLLLGSVAETVVRRSPVPVTVVRTTDEEEFEPPERVLVPFDASAQSRKALRYALGRFTDADVTALYVLYPSESIPTGMPDHEGTFGILEDWDESRDEHAREVLEAAEELATEFDRSVDTTHVEGRPEDAIVEYVEEDGIEHVVIGSTGRDGLGRLVLGSVAETVVRRSPVSVTVPK